MKKLLEEIKVQQEMEGTDGALPIVSLDMFFEGNNDEGSIGCNIIPHPGISLFYQTLTSISELKEVQTIFIEIYETDLGDVYWPFSERCYIISSLKINEICDLISQLSPSSIEEGWEYGKPKKSTKTNEQYNVYKIWWD